MRRQTIASRLIFLIICIAIVTTTLVFGTVHYWALTVFASSAGLIVCLWCLDGLILRSVQLSRNPLQLPIIGMILVGLIQLIPWRTPDNAGLPLSPVRTLSLDPYATRLVLVQVVCLLIYFSATLTFIDSPKRLRIITRTVTIFGFLLAMFGLTQFITTDGSKVFWLRQLTQSQAFGPFINRHHFAAYMEMTMALPLGLIFSRAIENSKLPLYLFAIAIMGIALITTNSRGGMLSLGAEILFIVMVAGPGLFQGQHQPRANRMRAALLRAGLAFAFIVLLIGGALAIGGSAAFTRLLGTVNAADPTSGRAHFWSVTLEVIKAHPVIGSGLGAFSVIYTRYDTRNGLFRLEQAHNDYLQIVADEGIVGGLIGLAFIVFLFRQSFARRETDDKFRRGVTTGALAGCFAVLIHSFFDFTLHTTANGLLFLILAALATQDNRVNRETQHRRHRHHHRRRSELEEVPVAEHRSESGRISNTGHRAEPNR